MDYKLIKIPVITTLHGTDITLIGTDPSCKPVINYSINNSDGVTSVSESLKNDTIKLFDIKKDIKVIPNFIDHNIFNKSIKNIYRERFCKNGEKLMAEICSLPMYDEKGLILRGIDKNIPDKPNPWFEK